MLELTSEYLYDARIIRDFATLRLDKILKEPDQIWVLMRITPDRSSGSVVAKGTYIRAETGEVVSELGVLPVIRVSGSWRLIAALKKALGQNAGRYEWELPFGGIRAINPNRFPVSWKAECPVISVICRYNPEAKGAEQFASVCLIPREWEEYAKPALTYLQKNLERLQQKSPQVTNDLRVLLDHKNPFVAVTACNLLAERNGPDQDFARSSLAGAKGYQQAIFTYLLLTHPLRMKQDQWFEELSRIIEMADNSKQFAGVALGVSAPFRVHPLPSHSDREAMFRLLERLDKKQLKFGRHTKSDKYIISILERMRIRQKAPGPGKETIEKKSKKKRRKK